MNVNPAQETFLNSDLSLVYIHIEHLGWVPLVNLDLWSIFFLLATDMTLSLSPPVSQRVSSTAGRGPQLQ